MACRCASSATASTYGTLAANPIGLVQRHRLPRRLAGRSVPQALYWCAFPIVGVLGALDHVLGADAGMPAGWQCSATQRTAVGAISAPRQSPFSSSVRGYPVLGHGAGWRKFSGGRRALAYRDPPLMLAWSRAAHAAMVAVSGRGVGDRSMRILIAGHHRRRG